MLHTKHHIVYLSVILLIALFQFSCSEEITHDEFVIGYAGQFVFFDLPQDSSVQINIDAYKFEKPDRITTSLNGKQLNSFTIQPSGAVLDQTVQVAKQGSVNLLLKYEGRKINYRAPLLQRLSYEDIEVKDSTEANRILLQWSEIDGADYYSIDIIHDTYHYLVWDTLLAGQGQNQLSLERQLLSGYRSLQVNVSAVKGPLPDEEFYNLDGDIAGKFLLISSSYIRYYPLSLNKRSVMSKESRSLIDEKELQNVVISNIFNRYSNKY